MIFGIGLSVLGYVLLYWGIHHFPGMTRHSFWELMWPQGVPPLQMGHMKPVQAK